MSNPYNGEQLMTKLQELPEPLQEAILSVDTAEKIKTIGSKNRLHIDQMGKLGEQVLLAMLGLTQPVNFVAQLEKNIRVDRERAEAITHDLNSAIFLPIVKLLRQKSKAGETTFLNKANQPDNSQNSNQEKVATQTIPIISPSGVSQTPDFFDQKMKRLFTTTTDIRAEKESAPIINDTAEGLLHQSKTLPTTTPPDELKPAGLDPYREAPE